MQDSLDTGATFDFGLKGKPCSLAQMSPNLAMLYVSLFLSSGLPLDNIRRISQSQPQVLIPFIVCYKWLTTISPNFVMLFFDGGCPLLTQIVRLFYLHNMAV